MTSEKKKPSKSKPAKGDPKEVVPQGVLPPPQPAFTVRVLNQESKSQTLDDLINAKMGLYIPLANMSKKERAALEAFLAASKSEPIAMALAAFAKDANKDADKD